MPKTRVLAGPVAIAPGAVLELLKPVTWFAPMWAFACGAVSGSHRGEAFPWAMMLAGMILAGPLVCGASQAINDWCDRHVDAINQPERPIPSGRLPGQSGLVVAVAASALALLYAALLGPMVFGAAAVALACGWAYSAPPLRLKADGWVGPALTGLSYEGLAWITGTLVVGREEALHRPLLIGFVLLYSLGAHGIMTLNDFKAVEGDRATGVGSLPVRLGVRRAALLACFTMAVPQLVVVALLVGAGMPVRALAIAALLAAQGALMPRLVSDPERQALWYNGTGVTLFVAGMMIAAFAVRAGAGA